MKTVTICASMKFEKEMQRIAFLLETKHDLNVLQCVYNTDNLEISEKERSFLKNAHLGKLNSRMLFMLLIFTDILAIRFQKK